MGEKMLVLSWKYHNATFSNVISKFRDKGNYSDVTVACEGRFYPAHKLVLAACSEYFEDMFQHTSCKHPIVVLKDISAKNLEALLSYMYAGVANISQDDLASLIRAAESLCIKGLAVPDDSLLEPSEVTSPANTAQTAASKPKRRKRERSVGEVAPLASSRVEECPEVSGGEVEGCQQEDLITREAREEDFTGPPVPAPPTATPNNPVLECTPDMPFRSSFEDVVVKEELPEANPDMCCEGESGFSSASGLVAGKEEVQQTQDYLCHLEEGGVGEVKPGGATQPPHPTEANIPGCSRMPQDQDVGEGDGCYDGFPALDGFTCESQLELYNSLNLHTSQLHLPPFGMEGNRRGRSPKPLSNSALSKKLHRCVHCSYSTPWHSVFVRHCRTHSGEKPFTCSFCPFRSSRKSVIKRHCLSKHS